MARRTPDKCPHCTFCARHAWRAPVNPDKSELMQLGQDFIEASTKLLYYAATFAISVVSRTYLQVTSLYRELAVKP